MSIPRWLALIAGLLLASALLWTAYENTLTPASPVGAGGGSDTAARALRAYGGQAAWRNAHTIDSTVTVGGLLFQAKGINIPAHARLTIDVQRPHTVIDPVDAAGDVGVLDGFSVTIQSKDGRLLQQRDDARQHFQNASISIPWDALNLAYFLGTPFGATSPCPTSSSGPTSGGRSWQVASCRPTTAPAFLSTAAFSASGSTPTAACSVATITSRSRPRLASKWPTLSSSMPSLAASPTRRSGASSCLPS